MRLKVQSMPALLISVGIHAALVALVVASVFVGGATDSSGSGRAPGIVGSAAQGSAGGAAASIAAPHAGPSLDRTDGARYVGRYERANGERGSSVFQVELVNDGESEPHWALTLVDGQGPVQKLILVARDTFAFQLSPRQQVIFRRADDSVTAASVRRGRDTTWASRVAFSP